MIIGRIQIVIPNDFYVKDPISSELGKRILTEGLELMVEIGLEEFTFKKLSVRISTTESSIYRYFESKNQFLFYLFNYYWSWMEYHLLLTTTNIECPEEKLKRAIRLITMTIQENNSDESIQIPVLQELIMLESSKTFLSKKVDKENKLGYFKEYKLFIHKISSIASEINPQYPYPQALMSTIIESSLHQRFFTRHLPNLTNDVSDDNKLEDFFFQLAIHTLKNHKS
jgi:AcrR family transcriptional regulator